VHSIQFECEVKQLNMAYCEIVGSMMEIFKIIIELPRSLIHSVIDPKIDWEEERSSITGNSRSKAQRSLGTEQAGVHELP
jgi:hypothetical protein